MKLRHVIIDGNRPELGTATAALIEWGSTGTGNLVEWVKAYEPRGWSVLYIGEGDDLKCSGAIARYNELGPVGQHHYGMADGISLACSDSIVENNTIIDATDGGIVIFQAPGSLIANNTIRAENRVMFYGISMEDYGPWDGNFTGTRVTGNTIDAHGALIRRGISMGPHVGCIPSGEMILRSRGAIVTDNTLMGDHMGYGFVISGVEDWTVTGNVDLSTHYQPDREQDCFEETADPLGGFQIKHAASSGTFQEEFEEAVLGFTTSWWPTEALFAEECIKDLIGEETLNEIKAGKKGPLWSALEAIENSELFDRCVSVYQPPETTVPLGNVMVGISTLESFSIEVTLTNLSEIQAADMRNTEFLIDGFLVECHNLPEFIQPSGEARCIINDYVTPGFQVLKWYGFAYAGDDNGWGFEYPFRDEE